MTRLTAVLIACAALLNASTALAQRGPPFGISPSETAPKSQPQPDVQPQVTFTPRRMSFTGAVWTEPGGSFSFDKPRGWKDVDTASIPGAEQLEIVAGDEEGQCWFTRINRERTRALKPKQLIDARAQPISAELWSRIALNQPLLVGVAQVLENSVEYNGFWPVQVARLQGRNGEVYAAIHSRPGVDILAFCAAKDDSDQADLLNEIARSVTTPLDSHWQTQIY